MSKEPPSVPTLDVPRFRPCTPSHLINSIDSDQNITTDSVKYLLEQVSVINQYNDWVGRHVTEMYAYTRSLNNQIIPLSEFKLELLKQMSMEHSLDKEREITLRDKMRLYRVIAGLFLFVVYPLFLSQWQPGGYIFDIVKSIW